MSYALQVDRPRLFAQPALRRWLAWGAIACFAALLSACATAPAPTAQNSTQAAWSVLDLSQWQALHLPGKTATDYQLNSQAPADPQGARLALRARAQDSASMVRTPVHIAAEDLGRIHFSWNVPALIDGADMATRHGDDSPVRLVLAFEGDRSQFSAKDSALNELTRLVTGEEMPYATLMYVWCNTRPTGTVIHNARTDRIRKIVVESGPQGLKQWRHYLRDIRADYRVAFGQEPGALVGIGIMTDSDNTHSQATAWYGKISLH